MSKKRPREAVAPDTRLIEIYEDLANEDEEIRLKAAYVLLTQFSTKNTTIEQQKTVLKRLFRGLCSGRKAARLGFSVGLTEFLSQVFLHVDEQEIKASEIIDLLESETTVDGSTSGQVSPLF
jgi:DNA polymerase phi